MANDTVVTIVGNLTADPELRTINSGAQVVSFTVASTPRTWDRSINQFRDGNALFMECTAWRDMAQHIADSLTKGMRVIVQGRLTQDSWQDKATGQNRSRIRLQVDEIGPSLRYATAQVSRIARAGSYAGGANGGNANNGGGYNRPNSSFNGYSGGASAAGNSASAPASEPWAASAGSYDANGGFGGQDADPFGTGVSDEPAF